MDFADTFSDATISHTPTDDVPAPSPSSSKRKTGRKKFRETRHPVYRGVRQRNGDKWVCEVREPRNQSRIWLGTFPSPEMAARAHDVAVLALRGDSARLNFEDSPQVLPRAKSTSPADVQAAALAAAEMFRPNGVGHSSEAEERVVDEEEVFNRPALLADMAEGLLMAPPHVQKGYYWEEGDTQEFSLWNY